MRLTNKYDAVLHYNNNETSHYSTSSYAKCLEKLGQLEDIEDELGIDLVTLFKALKNGVYYFTSGKQLTNDSVSLISNYISLGFHEKLSYSLITDFEKILLSFKDYGKTWALTKEELLNGR